MAMPVGVGTFSEYLKIFLFVPFLYIQAVRSRELNGTGDIQVGFIFYHFYLLKALGFYSGNNAFTQQKGRQLFMTKIVAKKPLVDNLITIHLNLLKIFNLLSVLLIECLFFKHSR